MNALDNAHLISTDISVARKLLAASQRGEDPVKSQRYVSLARSACADIRAQLQRAALPRAELLRLAAALVAIEEQIEQFAPTRASSSPD